MYCIDIYTLENGKAPVREFLDSLNPKMKAKALRMIDLLESYGPDLRMPCSRYLNEGIFELRIQQSNDIGRVLYFFFTGQRIILTNGFIKKTQKTPQAVIETARQYKQDFERRFGNDKL